jgi:hypothetical protein
MNASPWVPLPFPAIARSAIQGLGVTDTPAAR